MSSPAAAAGGEWVIAPVSYVDPERRFCAYCGRPLARRYWRVRSERAETVYCDPAHAARHNISYEISQERRLVTE